MNKWLVVLALTAISGGSYYLLAHGPRHNTEIAAPAQPLDVEEFDTPDDSTADAQEPVDGGEDAAVPTLGREETVAKASRPNGTAADLEAIDDADGPGAATEGLAPDEPTDAAASAASGDSTAAAPTTP